MAQADRPGKAMSSRLLTMKFMQRAAASSPSSSPGRNAEPALKKQRLSDGSHRTSPLSTPSADARAVEEALAVEELKRQEALAREAAARGETKWYLNFEEPPAPTTQSPLRIISAGYSALDGTNPARIDYSSEEDEGEHNGGVTEFKGRRSFGKPIKAAEKQQRPNGTSSEISSDSGSSDELEEDDTDSNAASTPSRGRTAEKYTPRKGKRKSDTGDADRIADERRQKIQDVNLKRLTSISGGGGRGIPHKGDMVCYGCGQKGHARRECPKSSR